MNTSTLTAEELERLTDLAYTRLTTTLKQFENTLSTPHSDALRALVASMTNMASGELQGRYAFGLGTGLGKTSAIIAWLAAVEELRFHGIPAAVCASKVEALCQLKRDLIKNGVPAGKIGLLHTYRHDSSAPKDARVLPSGYASEPSTDDNDSRPIMLITHQMLRGSKRSLNEFMSYQGTKRNLLLYDESLIISDSWSISIRLLKAETAWLKAYHEGDNAYSEMFAYLETCRHAIADEIERQRTGEAAQLVDLPFLPSHLEAQFRSSLDQRTNSKTIRNLLEISNHQVRIIPTGVGGAVAYEISVPAEVTNIMVLDASQPIRKLAKLDDTIQDAEDVLGITLSQLKKFDQVTLHQMFAHGGRNTMKKSFSQKYQADRKISGEIIEVVKRIPVDEAVLMFTYVALTNGGTNYRNIIECDLKESGIDIDGKLSDGSARINILTWGQETSLNEYSHCSHIILAGVMHRDLLDLHGAYVGQKDDIKAEVSPGTIRELLTSEICHLIYQALSRGTCRVAENGHAKAMQGYIIHAYDDIQSELEKVMPGVVWKTWEPIDESLRKSGVIQKTAEKIIQHLSGLSPEVVKMSSRRVKKDLNLEDIPTRTWTHAMHEAMERGRTWLLDRSSLLRGSSLFEAA
jgi:hypothetical protein